MPKKGSKLDQIIDEIAYDLEIPKHRVNKVLTLTFKEIAYVLLFKKRAVMIRGFVKFVVAVRAAERGRALKKERELAEQSKNKEE